MSKKEEVIPAVIRAYLLSAGPKSANEIATFIDLNDFKLGKQSLSTLQITNLIKKYSLKDKSILSDIEKIPPAHSRAPVKYDIIQK